MRWWDIWQARTWARRLLRSGNAVILDTETTDLHGEVIQVAVIDLDGTTLLDTLVCPQQAITPAATAVHGITDEDVVGAPTLAQVAPQLLALTKGKSVLAYNAPYDHGVLSRGLQSVSIDPEHLADASSWGCVMRARSRYTGTPWARLGGNHQAIGDCLATLTVLQAIALESVHRLDTRVQAR